MDNLIKEMTIREAQTKMQECDIASYFIHEKRFEQLDDEDILTHNCFHLMKATAKIADYLEKKDHNLKIAEEFEKVLKEVIPDLFIYSLQFSNAFDIDLQKAFETRIEYVLNKYK